MEIDGAQKEGMGRARDFALRVKARERSPHVIACNLTPSCFGSQANV
jgi:hypothetical protein